MPTNNDSSQKNKAFISLDSALILTGLTAYTYIITYLNEKGFCEVFKIPSEYITIDTDKILTFGVTVIVAILVFAGFTYYSRSISETSFKSGFHKMLFKWNIILLFALTITYFFTPIIPYKFWGYVLILLIVNVFLIVRHYRKRKYSADVSAGEIEIQSPEVSSLAIVQLLATLAITSAFVSYLAGKSEAEKRSTFMVFAKKPNIIILKKYGESLICREYKEISGRNELMPGVTIIKIKDTDTLRLSYKELGHLDYLTNNTALVK
jgi:hypothetical protein